MTSTTYPEFSTKTEALEVAEKFAGQIQGKTIIVTGANRDGIGFSTAQAFASQSPSHLILASRTPSKIQQCIDALKADYPTVDYRALKLDLSSQKNVRIAAEELLAWQDVPRVDIVVNSAGIMNLPERTINEDGLEMQFATNHIGHYLFTCLIMPKIIKAAEGKPKGATRIINVTSHSPTWSAMRWSDMNYEKINKTLPIAEQPPYHIHRNWGAVDPEEKSYLPLEGYNQSKVANVLFSIATTKRLYEKYGILSLALHPGVIKTELSRSASTETMETVKQMFDTGVFTYITQGAGAATSLVAATDPKLGLPETKNGVENYGVYLADCHISTKGRDLAVSSDEAEKLWKLSEDLVGEKFAW